MAERTRLRLDRALARLGLGTRKEVRSLIKQGRVEVDGEVITDHGFILSDPAAAQVVLDDEMLTLRKHTHLMLNKPEGFVTANKDSRYPVVMDLIPAELQAGGLTSVGRLDIDTTGLILLTTDGELAHRLMSPKYQVEKMYRVLYQGRPFTDTDKEQFRLGIRLADRTVCLPAGLEILTGNAVQLKITEGKYHQVKKMLLATGREVTYLSRLSIGSLMLDPDLAAGDFRPLTRQEILDLYHLVRLEVDSNYL